MQTIEKRIAALELASPIVDRVQFIILTPMGDEDIDHIRDNYGNHWQRQPGEMEEAFKDRATSETPRIESQVAILFGEIAHIN